GRGRCGQARPARGGGAGASGVLSHRGAVESVGGRADDPARPRRAVDLLQVAEGPGGGAAAGHAGAHLLSRRHLQGATDPVARRARARWIRQANAAPPFGGGSALQACSRSTSPTFTPYASISMPSAAAGDERLDEASRLEALL